MSKKASSDFPKEFTNIVIWILILLMNLQASTIFFNNSSNFNDPYDNAFLCEIEDWSIDDIIKFFGKSGNGVELLIQEAFREECTREEIMNIIDMLCQTESHFRESFLSRFQLSDIEQRYSVIEYPGIQTDLVRIIRDCTSNLSRKSIQEDIGRIRNFKICCFSKIKDSMLMWSYYADGHKGFCLEFDTGISTFGKLHKVNYSRTFPKLNSNWILDPHNSTLIESLILTKFIDWKHEKEYRLLIERDTRWLEILPESALTGIYFGSKMDDSTLKMLMKMVKKIYPNCKCFKMAKDENSFKLKAKKINNNDLEYLF
ncbi:MAG: DUF2971 domain-containing protein [Saprospiraceae bacterium]|nr:DUF2971 domain-containing protein [Saprospiraceae bacterium]